MKKMMFFALAAAGMLASCSSEESFDVSQSSVVGQSSEISGHQPILIGTGSTAIISTKGQGTGTVGGVGTDANDWAGQRFKMFMFKKGTFDLALQDIVNFDVPVYDDSLFEATGSAEIVQAFAANAQEIKVDGTGTVTSRPIKYYPNEKQQAYDFWAYRLDSAEIIDPISGAYVIQDRTVGSYPLQPNEITPKTRIFYGDDNTDSLEISFKIDGSQDVMLAKAKPVNADGSEATAEPARYFSAWAARNGVNPKLEFEHMLTRLQFEVLAGDSSTMADVKVTGIEVASKANGRLMVAYKEGYTPDSLIHWGDAAPEWLTLRERTATATPADVLTEITDSAAIDTTTTTGWTRIGESLIVAPQEKYQMRIHIVDFKASEIGGTAQPYASTIDGIIKLDAGTFLKGHSYRVQIKIFGHAAIETQATIKAWEANQDVEVNPQDWE